MDSPTPPHLGRNDPCHCGSGRKYKQCCLEKDEAAAREARAKDREAEEKTAGAEPEKTKDRPPAAKGRAKGRDRDRDRQPQSQPWKKKAGNAHPVQRRTTPRKVGGG